VIARLKRAALLLWRRVPRAIRRRVVRLVAASYTVGANCLIERGDGDVALRRLAEVSGGSMQALEGQERREFVDRLVQGRGQHDFQALLAHLKAEAEVVLHEDLRQNGQ
jgi:hypothetical protein